MFLFPWMIILSISIILSIIVAALGSGRVIGFWWSLIASIFLSPVIGLIIVLCSERKSDRKYKEKMLQYMRNSENSNANSTQKTYVRHWEPEAEEVLEKIDKFKARKNNTDNVINKYGVRILISIAIVIIVLCVIFKS